MFFPNLFTAATVLLAGFASAVPLNSNGHDLDLVGRDSLSKRANPAGPLLRVADGGGGYMRATRLQDGSILGAYAWGGGDAHILRTVRSTDNGATWETRGVITAGNSDQHDIDNVNVVQLPNGTILAAFRNHDKPGGNYSYYRITVCQSTDGGWTWTYLSQVDERARGNNNGLWEPFLRVARNGNVQCYYSSETQNFANGADQDNIMRVSTDNGRTWGNWIGVSGQGMTSRDGMVGVAELDGKGSLIAVFENTETGPFSVDYVISRNDGFSWGERGHVYKSPNNGHAGAPQVVNVGGTIIVDFMTNEDGGDCCGVDNGAMKTVRSDDQGRSFGGLTTIGQVGSHWPGMLSLDNNRFLAMYGLNGQGMVAAAWNK